MITCITCGTDLEPGSVGAIAVKVKQYADSNYGWGYFDEGDTFTIDGQKAEVVKVRKAWNDGGDDSEDYSYARQGQTFDAFVVVKVGDLFFRKSGTGDSYGEVSWDGDFGPVQMKSKQVTVYEF